MNKAISELLSKSTSEGSLIGVNCLVFKDGKELYSGSFGFADRENKIPMSRDSIYRLFSLSKPVTSAATMILIDRGILSPDDPVSKFFPEYADLRYSAGRDESGSEIILPCPDELKISHLLTMTSGLPYANNFCESVCASARLFDAVIRGNDGQGAEVTTEEFTRRAAEIPLMFRPGEHWDYGISADILGGVIEKASGVKYSRFLKENIFEPLGMNDTGFFIPAEKLSRFTALYKYENDKLIRDHENYLGLYRSPVIRVRRCWTGFNYRRLCEICKYALQSRKIRRCSAYKFRNIQLHDCSEARRCSAVRPVGTPQRIQLRLPYEDHDGRILCRNQDLER